MPQQTEISVFDQTIEKNRAVVEKAVTSTGTFVHLKMKLFRINQATIAQLQWLVWVSVYLITFFSILPMDGFYQSFVFTLINTCFYALIIYGHISYLFPRYYEQDRKVHYIIYVVVLLIFCGLSKGLLISYLYNTYFAIRAERSPVSSTVVYYSLTNILVYVLSFIFRVALAYFSLKRQTEEIQLQKTQAELNLLKSQVQPHFLFNTLNNIYYEAYIEAPRTAGLIARLADMMRYFVEESPKAEVFIATEIGFLENYIELEKIRVRYGVSISFIKGFPVDAMVPPMLLMTFVENIFKHGIDKSSHTNEIEISLLQQDGYLVFQTKNSASHTSAGNSGSGLANLRKRLVLLYGDRFELFTNYTSPYFIACFKIPIL